MRIAIIDTETTGLDWKKATVLEFACILIDDGEEVHRWVTKIKPTPKELADADPYSLNLNGYSDEAWEDAPSMEEVGRQIVEILQGRVLVGHNPGFDEVMLQQSLKRHSIPGKIPYRKIDTQVLVMEHLFPLGLDRCNLNAVRLFLGWPTGGSHRAMKDAEDALRLFNLLWRMTRWQQLLFRLTLRFGGSV